MIDFSKLYCSQHPYELITNFCADPGCLVGLCATCICSHTDKHTKDRTQPSYQNIRTTFSRVHQELRNQIDIISEDKQRLNQLFDAIKQKQNNFKAILAKAKQDSLDVVEKYFSQLQKKWQTKMIHEQKNNSLHSIHRLESLSALLSRQMNTLLYKANEINSSTFIYEIKKIERQLLVESNEFHQKIKSQIEFNEKYTPIVGYNIESLQPNIFACLDRIMSLEFSIPIKNSKVVMQPTKRSSSTLKSDRLSNINPQAIVFQRPVSIERPKQSIMMNQSLIIPTQITTATTMTASDYFYRPINQVGNSIIKPISRNSSQILQKSRISKFNIPSGFDYQKFMKEDKKIDNLKPKRSGLSLIVQETHLQPLSQKQNQIK